MSDNTDSMLIGRITVGTRRQYAEQSLKWDAAIASEKTDDELLQRIWNLAEDGIALIAALAEARQRIAYLTAEAHGWQPRLAKAEADNARLRAWGEEHGWMGDDPEVERGDLQRAIRQFAALARGDAL